MLSQLSIKDFIIVEQVDLSIQTGLTIVTGETGAGKSILIAALSLVLGERGSSDVVRPQCQQAQLSADFEVNPAVLTWLQAHDLDDGETCVLRRVITENGRSRAYINGQLTSLQNLRSLGYLLVAIHSQHAHQSLMLAENQRHLLDTMAGHDDLLNQVAKLYKQWKKYHDKLQELGGKAADRAAQMQLLNYQIEELEQLNISEETLQDISNEHRRLAYGNQLLAQGQKTLLQLEDEQTGVLSSLAQVQRDVGDMLTHDSSLESLATLLEGAMIQASEASSELNQYLSQLEHDPARLQQLDDLFASLQDVARKHQVKVEQLPQHLAHLLAQLEGLKAVEQQAIDLEQDLIKVRQQYDVVAAKLSQQRHQIAPQLAQKISDNIQQLGMPNGQFQIMVNTAENKQPSASGLDDVDFLISTNIGQAPKPLNKIASGGELSRISLAIQVINAQGSGVSLLVFDEVDVGIGGGIAEIVGQKLAELGQQRQVLCITHLPQVACCGQQHLKVVKTADTKQTLSHIIELSAQQRTEEVARMLGGQKITAQTLAHAQEMLGMALESD